MAAHPLDHVAEQLWGAAFERSPALRAVVNPRPDPQWRSVESYWLIPGGSSARMLIPRGVPVAASRLLTNYRRLRTPTTNAARFALGAAARAGLPLSAERVDVQVRCDAPAGTVDLLPLSRLSRALGTDVVAATGIRSSDNRKAMLHLVDVVGTPIGYAKFGWNETTDELVATEGATLAEIGGRPGRTRAPRLLARLDYHGHPVIVTEPLPADVRGSSTGVVAPTPEELFDLTPVARHTRVRDTAQFRETCFRLTEALGTGHVRELADQALAVAAELTWYGPAVPVTTRWHGDLAPWNRARDRSGQLWVWDWENAGRDAVAGLDAVHWAFSTQRLHARDVNKMSLDACLADADPYLTAIGLGASDRKVVGALYVVATVERACTLACRAGTWDLAFIAPHGLGHLLRQAQRALELAGPTPTSGSGLVATTSTARHVRRSGSATSTPTEAT